MSSTRYSARSRDSFSRGTGGLTPREVQVLELIAAGFTNAEIAAQFYISHETVKSHVRHILEKTGSRTRAQAACSAVQLGAIEVKEIEKPDAFRIARAKAPMRARSGWPAPAPPPPDPGDTLWEAPALEDAEPSLWPRGFTIRGWLARMWPRR